MAIMPGKKPAANSLPMSVSNAQRAARRNTAGGQTVVIVVLAHIGHGYTTHGRGGGHTGATECTKGTTGNNRGHRQTTTQVANKGVSGFVQVLGQARGIDQITHQDEQRQHGKAVAHGRVVAGLRRHGQGRFHAGKEGKTQRTNQQHAPGNGQTQK
uniref:Uncharacterized protein n=1 Tax=Panagrolaimus superbus TaxID=310955 RepID=A0A914Z9K6_9BILA